MYAPAPAPAPADDVNTAAAAAAAVGAGGVPPATGPFVPQIGESEVASMMDGYDAWCQHMANTGGTIPSYQWPGVNDQGLNFFY
ncbi:hypothetical protein GMORB2_0507 [Geosmithia morbida]|uniref:Uncharacterized protein n=1 Tax=Geosmithia morbida TaxID=1094350 RepID=A0A9P5D8G6_9HYPO|nr:uncharacterized protein GMORB2_0507 [Geosmithia morbida]KAF4126770.1 hypothetical protein GMORB2_0507 [Geosmithia morbida]